MSSYNVIKMDKMSIIFQDKIDNKNNSNDNKYVSSNLDFKNDDTKSIKNKQPETFDGKNSHSINSLPILSNLKIDNISSFENIHQKVFDSNKIFKYWNDQKPVKDNNKDFQDPLFPANSNSLLSINDKGEFIDKMYYLKYKKEFEQVINFEKKGNIKWARASKLINNPVLFDKIEISDIKQGKLGNCYFLSAISSFAEFPEKLSSLFRTKSINKYGYYEIVFFIDGEWQIVIIDDYIPVQVNKKIKHNHMNDRDNEKYIIKPLGARPKDNEIWVLLLEKAFAKINRGYTNMIAGHPKEIFNLFGFRPKSIKISEFNIDDLGEKILSYNNKNCIMCCSTKKNKDFVETAGLKTGHAYSLIEAKEYIKTNSGKNTENNNENINDKNKSYSKDENIIKNKDLKDKNNININEENQNNRKSESGMSDNSNENIYLLQLRNPWGKFEPKLDWNDNYHLWNNELRKYFGFLNKNKDIQNSDDGLFFISLNDFYKYFSKIEISYPCLNLNIKTINLDNIKIMNNDNNLKSTYESHINMEFPQIFFFEIFEKSKVHIVIDVPYWRYNRDQKLNNKDNKDLNNFETKEWKSPKILILGKYFPNSKEITFMDYEFNILFFYFLLSSILSN